MSDTVSGLALLRAPFPAHQISKLPKPTKAQTDAVKADFKVGIRCGVCGAWHHPQVVHLDYVGHAALTDRLLDADPAWSWEPAALDGGLPAFDQSGGLWIKLTVCGVTRLGYGHAAAKPQMDPGAREKEVIGDALRNAAMRFGAALDLWHKGDLHVISEGESDEPKPAAASFDIHHAGPDFDGMEGVKGKSAHAARNDGTAQLYQEIEDEIDALESSAAVGAFKAGRSAVIRTFPEEWRKHLRERLDEQTKVIREREAKAAEDDFPGSRVNGVSGARDREAVA